MFMLNKRVQKLIASGTAFLITLTVMIGAAWAILSTEQMGLSVSVSYTSPVTAKVYLATNSSTAGQFYQDSPTVNTGTGTDFNTENSALVLDTKDGGTLQKNAFELLGAGNGLKCDANGEMEFYVYVENYSESETIFCSSDVIFTDANGVAPFSVISNPMSITGTAIEAGTPTKSLLTFRIKSTNSEGLNANTIKIEIDLEASSSLETLSWNTIAQISEMGLASQVFNVGDEKDVSINGVPYTFVILGFNHDDKSDGSGKAGITFGMKNLLATKYNMNSDSTNSYGWEGSAMRSRMTNTFLTQLPPDLQSAIKEVNKKATAGSTSTSIQTSKDKLFLFSEREIDGTTEAGYVGEGTRYAYYVSNPSRVKKLSNGSGSPGSWWLRSPYVKKTFAFRYFDGSGGISYDYASSTCGVCFGFCV